MAYYPGEIGVAVIINNTDTITVNNKSIYPMMSVFKVHQALAICDDFGHKGFSLDSLMTIHRDELDPQNVESYNERTSGTCDSIESKRFIIAIRSF